VFVVALVMSGNHLDSRRLVSALVSRAPNILADDYSFVRGQRSSLEILIPEMMKIDLSKLGSDFRVPVLFFEGRHDPYSRPSLIEEYSQTIHAPQTEVIWFETSGHFPFFEEQQKFADELFERVLPLAADRQDGHSFVSPSSDVVCRRTASTHCG
jgi:pimeloyl-ACP methyl ester carboxylesterase